MAYFKNIFSVSRSIVIGMIITIRYFFRTDTVITVEYPKEMDEIPEAHRGIHFLETDKCIMCFFCARACPVDCIEIVGTRDGELEEGFAGKGASMVQFTIDYGECIFCHLCIEPCPVDCIHMKPKRFLETQPPGYEGTTGLENVKFEFDHSGFRREDLVKNLLTDRVFTTDDVALVERTAVEIDRLAEEKKAAKKKKAAEAAAKKKKKAEEEAAAAEKKE
jgi:NADH-quinone oxidoreductase subunit I